MNVTDRFYIHKGSFYFDTLDSGASLLGLIDPLDPSRGLDWSLISTSTRYLPSSIEVLTLLDAIREHRSETNYKYLYDITITALEGYLYEVQDVV